MRVELRLSNRLTLTGVIVAVLLSARGALAGASEDCAAAQGAYDQQNFAEVLRLCQPLADQGNADAQTLLGMMYAKGEGVPRPDAKAAEWSRRPIRETQKGRPSSASCTSRAEA
jgi:hypothetical protein